MKQTLNKSIGVLLLVLLFTNIGYTQSLSFFDLKYLLTHNVDDADTYITKKGYKFDSVEKFEFCDEMGWSYNRNTQNNKAISFVYKHCFDANKGFIYYQPEDRKDYDQIRDYCKSIGFNFTKTEITPHNSLNIMYENNEYKIEFGSGINEGRNVYKINLQFK